MNQEHLARLTEAMEELQAASGFTQRARRGAEPVEQRERWKASPG